MTIFRKTLLALGVVGLGSVISAPAFAQTAYISGASAMTLMNGATQSIGAELSLPSGGYFTGGTSSFIGTPATVGPPPTPVSGGTVEGGVVLTPTLSNVASTPGLSTNNQGYREIVVDAGLPNTNTANLIAGSSFSSAAARVLNNYLDTDTTTAGNQSDLQAQVSVIRAGAGVDGLD